MSAQRNTYPIIDLFAGPGGLGEGFLSSVDTKGRFRFRDSVSIERDNFSHQTLLLRHFLRAFGERGFPKEYYTYLDGKISREALFELYPEQLRHAEESALRISLGKEEHDRVRGIIDERLKGENKWALIGGPPCQAYSLVGRSRMMNNPDFQEDERHFLYREYLKIIADHSPPVFVMENVKGLLSAKVKGEPVITRILADLSKPGEALADKNESLGYRLYSLSEEGEMTSDADPRQFLVKAEEYGVPQARHRMFIVGIRGDIDIVPRQLQRSTPPTVEETIGMLPKVRSGLSRQDSLEAWKSVISEFDKSALAGHLNGHKYAKDVVSEVRLALDEIARNPLERSSSKYPARSNSPHKAVQSLYDDRLTTLTSHEARGHMPSDLHRYLFSAAFTAHAKRSPKLSDFPDFLLPEHKNVARGQAGEMFSDRFRVQKKDQHSTTVTSHISKDGHYFIHYDPAQCRSLTVREAARLQTFPDNYKFEGPRTAQFHQIGNAVPPFLAGQIAEIIAEVLDSMPDSD
ncbi:DNA cytosine methyltransferase [Oricola indica]|jgi:DNA (cytosine-5)-methyltransferase 1|uniref:DNA cytosine methyltransferase n=1 Tax=Oricola indica TaxID=2872591 RepID=UPI001CBC295E|nr:DNA cytosine methyltransferase [Oricola indica]